MIKQVDRGGLKKPCDLLFVTSLFVFSFYFRLKESIYSSKFHQLKHPRKVFLLACLNIISKKNESIILSQTECQAGHNVEKILRTTCSKLFNTFSKNYMTIFNSDIHEQKKRKESEDTCGKKKIAKFLLRTTVQQATCY